MPNDEIAGLVGSFVLVTNKDHETFRTGEIIKQVSPGYYFVQFDAVGGDDMPEPMELVGEAEMASVCENCGERQWSFFPSREQLQKYVAWLETAAEPKIKVVPIKDHLKHVPPTKDKH